MRINGGILGRANVPNPGTATSGEFSNNNIFQYVQQNLWPVAQIPAAFKVERSLRFNGTSKYLTRTFANNGNLTTWTYSLWVKKTLLSAYQDLLGTATTTLNYAWLEFNNDDTLYWAHYNGGYISQLKTTQLFNDPAAWYHLVLAYDSTQSTASNRIKLYVNGTQITSFSTAAYPSQNQTTLINTNVAHYIGMLGPAYANYFFDGYMTEVNFIDGRALTPTSFGEFDAVTNTWVPIRYSGGYGFNGFYLNFSDASDITAATLGKDSAPLDTTTQTIAHTAANNWTPTNFTLANDSTCDTMLDVPTNWGTFVYATSGATRGNYATFNPIAAGGATLSNGNLDISATANQSRYVTMNLPTQGKWYFEFTVNSLGLTNTGFWIVTSRGGVFGLPASGAYRILKDAADISISGSGTPAAGHTMKVAYDADNARIWFGRDTLWFSNAGNTISDPNTTSNPSFSGFTPTTDDVIYVLQSGGGAATCTGSINFGQRPFKYAPPAGYLPMCTQSLITPAIQKSCTAMDAVLYTGTGSALTVSGLGFSPGLLWLKNRTLGVGGNHVIFDSVRGGPSNELYPNLTNSEAATTGALQSLNSDGFSLSNAGDLVRYNNNTNQYVAWSWDAGSTTVTNTDGSITSTIRANPRAGFSIVSWAGTGANATIGHGLGATPRMIIMKNRDAGTNWAVYHGSLANTEYLLLNSTAGKATGATYWNSSTPTPSVFYTGTANDVAFNNMIAYCFADVEGYSKFGSYTGNGSSDGTFVWCGFRPKYLMIKRTDSTDSWVIEDSLRNTFNTNSKYLLADSPAAEVTGSVLRDFLSNGFKARSTNQNLNTATYIFAAFAEVPFKYANAR